MPTSSRDSRGPLRTGGRLTKPQNEARPLGTKPEKKAKAPKQGKGVKGPGPVPVPAAVRPFQRPAPEPDRLQLAESPDAPMSQTEADLTQLLREQTVAVIDIPPAPEGTYREYPLLADLPKIVREYVQLQGEIDAVVAKHQARIDKLKADAEALLIISDPGDGNKTFTVTVGDRRVQRQVRKGHKKIDESKLLEHGVLPSVIHASTVEGAPYSCILIQYAGKGQKQSETDDASTTQQTA
jgi:hypothetical protein